MINLLNIDNNCWPLKRPGVFFALKRAGSLQVILFPVSRFNDSKKKEWFLSTSPRNKYSHK